MVDINKTNGQSIGSQSAIGAPYTPEEVCLNKQLFIACEREPIDFLEVERLLQLGADPLGETEAGEGDYIYGECACNSQENDSKDLPRLTELFLKYGMDVDNPRIPYDGGDRINPMWLFAFSTNENSIIALKMLLDAGLSVESFGEFWGHALGDLLDISCGDPAHSKFWNHACTWTLKMLMLGASYDYILEGDEDLQQFIGCSYNGYDVRKFRNWNAYRYEFDTSLCKGKPELCGSVVHIYDVKIGQEVWTIRVCLD